MADWHLYLASFLTAIVSGTIGMAGGVLLMSYMAVFFPPAILIPLHGIVQLSSNLSRVALSFKNIVRDIALASFAGGIVGGLLGSQVVINLPEREFKILIAVVTIVLTWLPKLKSNIKIPGQFFFLGGIITFLSLFIGAVGPLLAAFLVRNDLKRENLVATQAACQAGTHFVKILVFFSLGFVIGPYLPIMIGMIAFGFLGNWVGKKLLNRIPTQKFTIAVKIVISLLAIKLFFDGLKLFEF
ncbi:MAG: sulfite exporter TauE/SafE family protein [Pseudomonadota bacterium]|nr:sulfite exporter TauE/SafE family protein [Pseudomonadota bacterium]